jgi:hypothetical protein
VTYDHDDEPHEQARRRAIELQRNPVFLDDPRQVESIIARGMADDRPHRQARVAHRPVQDGVEMIGETLRDATRQLCSHSGRYAAG